MIALVFKFTKSVLLIPTVVALWLVGGAPAVGQLAPADATHAPAEATPPHGAPLVVPPPAGRPLSEVSQVAVVAQDASGARVTVRYWDQTASAYEIDYRAGAPRGVMRVAPGTLAASAGRPPLRASAPYSVTREHDMFHIEREDGARADLVWSTSERACDHGAVLHNPSAPAVQQVFKVCHRDAPEVCADVEQTPRCYNAMTLRPVTALLVGDTVWFVAESEHTPTHTARTLTGLPFLP